MAAAMLIAAATSAQASVEISSKPTHNMNCVAGVCTPTAKNADLNATDLANMLAASDVKVVTGAGAVTITVSSSFSWTSTHRLTLDANLNVSFRAPVVVAGQGAVTIVTNDGGRGGDLIFFDGGNIVFWDLSSSLIIDNTQYALINSLSGLAHDIMAQPSGSYAFANSYDASVDGTYSQPPVQTKFTGLFNGLGNAIANLTIADTSKTDPVGLFSYVDVGGRIQNIVLTNANVSGQSKVSGSGLGASGSLVGINYGSITRSRSSVSINSGGQVGGLVGFNRGLISNCAASGKIRVRAHAGGLVNFNQNGTIEDSSAAVDIESKSGSGGLVSDNQGLIQRSFATGTVSSKDTKAFSINGGLVGLNEGPIAQSHASGTVSGTLAGGLAGENFNPRIDKSYATGNVSGTSYAGGLVGWNGHATVTNSYASGSVTGQGDALVGGLVGDECCADGISDTIATSYSTGAVSGGSMAGGLVGKDETDKPEISDAYWDLDTSGISNPSQGAGSPANDPGITGLTDAQLRSGLPTGFDPNIWAINKKINSGYPYLLANPPPQ